MPGFILGDGLTSDFLSVTDDLGICNAALARIGSTAWVTELPGTTVEGELFYRFYDHVRQRLLTAVPWNFNRLNFTLTDVSELVVLPDKWAFAYEYPDLAVKIRGIYPEKLKIPFEISMVIDASTGDPYEKRVILTGQDEAIAVISADTSTEYLTVPAFVDLFVWALAEMIAIPLRVDAKIYQMVVQRYQFELGRVTALLANEESFKEDDSDFITLRR